MPCFVVYSHYLGRIFSLALAAWCRLLQDNGTSVVGKNELSNSQTQTLHRMDGWPFGRHPTSVTQAPGAALLQRFQRIERACLWQAEKLPMAIFQIGIRLTIYVPIGFRHTAIMKRMTFMSTPNTDRFHVFGVCPPTDYCLFVDYVLDDIKDHENSLLQRIQQTPDPALRVWREGTALQGADIFEIECVNDRESAQEAVEFWRAYFRSLGETIIKAEHLCDRLE